MRYRLIGKKGQPEHIFSDAIPGIALIIIGVIIISVTYDDAREKSKRELNTKIVNSHAERQILQLLQTKLDINGESREIWKIIQDAKDNQGLKSPTELSGSGFSLYGMFFGDYRVLDEYATNTFERLFGQGKWFMLVHYNELPYDVSIGYNPLFVDDCTRMNGIEKSTSVEVPGEKLITTELHYCLIG